MNKLKAKKIAYVGIDLLFPCLEFLYENECEILKIFTCKCDNVTEFNLETVAFAEKHNIKYTYDRIRIEDLLQLKNLGCELLICGAYYYKIPAPENVDKNYFPLINIHPAKIPEYRGPWPMPVILLNKDASSEVTILKISENLDEGDIIISKEFILDDDDDLKSYMKKANIVAVELLKSLFSNFETIYNNSTSQNLNDSSAEYVPMPSEDMYTITSLMTVNEAEIILRAFYGYECIYIKSNLDDRQNENNDIEKYEIIDGEIYKGQHLEEDSAYKLFDLLDGQIISSRYRRL